MSTIGSCLAFSSLEVRSVSVCRRPTTSLRITRMPSMISITGLICSGSAPLPLAVSHQAYGTRFPTSRGTRRYIGLAFVKHHGRPSDSREVLTLTNQANLAAQLMAAIFVLFVRRFRQPEWRPLRGFLFSFMASSALYPIIYASFF
jgi:hypothetical protein